MWNVKNSILRKLLLTANSNLANDKNTGKKLCNLLSNMEIFFSNTVN